MPRKTLTEQFDEFQFSQRAEDLAAYLSCYTATDEMGAVVLIAAALLLAGECPGETAASAAALNRLTDEFGDLAFRMHRELVDRRGPRAGLRVVGGTDMIGGVA